MHKAKCWIQILVFGAIAMLALGSSPSRTEPWPQRTVRFIVPVGAGTAADVAARLFAERLAERWKHPVVVENRPGADGLTGAAAFAGMRDDHTLLFSFAAPISVFPVLQEKLPYDPARDFVPISMASDVFMTVAASESLKVGSLAQLEARARAEPGKLNYNSSAGALPYLFGGFLKSLGLDMVLISYRELNLAYHDLAEGQLQVMLAALTGMRPLAQAGKIRLLAVINKVRPPMEPALPTVAEAGYPALTLESMIGLFGPRDMPNDVRDRIGADMHAVAGDRVLTSRLIAIGQIARGTTPAEFSAAIEEQHEKISSMVKLLGTKPLQ